MAICSLSASQFTLPVPLGSFIKILHISRVSLGIHSHAGFLLTWNLFTQYFLVFISPLLEGHLYNHLPPTIIYKEMYASCPIITITKQEGGRYNLIISLSECPVITELILQTGYFKAYWRLMGFIPNLLVLKFNG